MTEHTESAGGQPMHQWNKAAWSTAAVILLLPVVAMQFTDEVAWDLADFLVFGAMLVAACGAYELASRMSANTAYRAGVGVAIATAFVLVWVNLAVGIIGNESNPANLIYFGVLALAIIGASIARFQSTGMARALVAMALAQALVAVFALMAGMDVTLIITGILVALWLTSAWLFRKAARQVPAAESISGS